MLQYALCRDEVVQPEDDDDVRNLRERRPNVSNRSELLQLMDTTRDERRAWIIFKKPSITEVLERYPRLQDIDTAVSFVHFVFFVARYCASAASAVMWCVSVMFVNCVKMNGAGGLR